MIAAIFTALVLLAGFLGWLAAEWQHRTMLTRLHEPVEGEWYTVKPGDHIVGSIASIHVVQSIVAIVNDMNRAIAISRGDPWPPVHRKPLQHRPGCRDASCVGCRE